MNLYPKQEFTSQTKEGSKQEKKEKVLDNEAK